MPMIDTSLQPGAIGIDGLSVVLTGRPLNWNVGPSVAYGALFDAPIDWWKPYTTNVSGWITSMPATPVTTYATPNVEFNQVTGTTGLAGLFVSISDWYGGGCPPGEWSQGSFGSGGFNVNTNSHFITSKVSLTTSNACNTVIDSDTGAAGADAGRIDVKLRDFAEGTYSVSFQVITIFSASGGGAGGGVTITSGANVPINHRLDNSGTSSLTARFVDNVTTSVTVDSSGSAAAFSWTPSIEMNLATVENTTIEGHIAMTSISKQ